MRKIFLLIIIVFWFIIISGCGKKEDQIKDINQLTWTNLPTHGTGDIMTGEQTKIEGITWTSQIKDINILAKEVLLDYYSKMNQGKYEEALNYYSTGLRNYPSIKREFGTGKLEKFYKAVDNDLTISNIIQTAFWNKKTFTYSVYYEINGTLYNEVRRLSLKYNETNLSKPWEIVEIMCDKNCEKYPFFNMKKFGLE